MTAEEKLRAYEDFVEHVFWRQCIVPVLQGIMAKAVLQLRTCPMEDVERVRALIDAFEKILTLPAKLKDMAKDDIALDAFYRQQENEQQGKTGGGDDGSLHG